MYSSRIAIIHNKRANMHEAAYLSTIKKRSIYIKDWENR